MASRMRARRGLMAFVLPTLQPAEAGLVPVWTIVRSGQQLVHAAFTRILVGPPAHEARAMADPLPCDVLERDLAHELGPQPLPDQLLVGLPAARLALAALVGAVRLELVDQLALLLRLEARRVADHVQLVGVVVEPKDERADRALLLAEAECLD